jgi:hypothetical protein
MREGWLVGMGCKNCGKKSIGAAADAKEVFGATKFGRCSRCFFLAIIGLLISILLLIFSLFINLPARLAWIRIIPLAFFAIWLTLHLIGYFIHQLRGMMRLSSSERH